MSKETQGQVFGLMDNLLEKIRAEKRAAQKKATDGSEPTSHPVMNADDGTQPAREGSRSSENEADVSKDYGVLGNTGQEDANSADSTNQALAFLARSCNLAPTSTRLASCLATLVIMTKVFILYLPAIDQPGQGVNDM